MTKDMEWDGERGNGRLCSWASRIMNSCTCHMPQTDSWQLHFTPLSVSPLLFQFPNLSLCVSASHPTYCTHCMLIPHHPFCSLPPSLAPPVCLLNILNQPPWSCWTAAATSWKCVLIRQGGTAASGRIKKKLGKQNRTRFFKKSTSLTDLCATPTRWDRHSWPHVFPFNRALTRRAECESWQLFSGQKRAERVREGRRRNTEISREDCDLRKASTHQGFLSGGCCETVIVCFCPSNSSSHRLWKSSKKQFVVSTCVKILHENKSNRMT